VHKQKKKKKRRKEKQRGPNESPEPCAKHPPNFVTKGARVICFCGERKKTQPRWTRTVVDHWPATHAGAPPPKKQKRPRAPNSGPAAQISSSRRDFPTGRRRKIIRKRNQCSTNGGGAGKRQFLGKVSWDPLETRQRKVQHTEERTAEPRPHEKRAAEGYGWLTLDESWPRPRKANTNRVRDKRNSRGTASHNADPMPAMGQAQHEKRKTRPQSRHAKPARRHGGGGGGLDRLPPIPQTRLIAVLLTATQPGVQRSRADIYITPSPGKRGRPAHVLPPGQKFFRRIFYSAAHHEWKAEALGPKPVHKKKQKITPNEFSTKTRN